MRDCALHTKGPPSSSKLNLGGFTFLGMQIAGDRSSSSSSSKGNDLKKVGQCTLNRRIHKQIYKRTR